jgi:hypothetical protein
MEWFLLEVCGTEKKPSTLVAMWMTAPQPLRQTQVAGSVDVPTLDISYWMFTERCPISFTSEILKLWVGGTNSSFPQKPRDWLIIQDD